MEMDSTCKLFYVMLLLIFEARAMKSYEILNHCKWEDMDRGIQMNAIVNLELIFNAN